MNNKCTVILNQPPKNLKMGHKVNGARVIGLMAFDALDGVDEYQQQEDELNVALGDPVWDALSISKNITTHKERVEKILWLKDEFDRMKQSLDMNRHHMRFQDGIVETLQAAIKIMERAVK